MAYLGNQPSNNFVSLKRQVITGNGGTSYTLDHSVASVNDVAIFVNNVRQDPATYSISGTALTLGGTISSSDSCYVIFLGQALQTVTPATGTVTNAMIASDAGIATSKLGTGAILQVQSTLKTDTFSSTTASSDVDITGLSVNITPSSTSSKILVMAHVTSNSNGASGVHFKIKRGSTVVGAGSDGSRTPFGFVTDAGQADGNRAITTGAYTFIDQPSSTSQQTYKVTYEQYNGSNTVRINTNLNVNGAAYDDIFTSGITVMEIAG